MTIIFFIKEGACEFRYQQILRWIKGLTVQIRKGLHYHIIIKC
jgi:hypothetical protein